MFLSGLTAVMVTLQQLGNVGQGVQFVDLKFGRGLSGTPRDKLSAKWYLQIL